MSEYSPLPGSAPDGTTHFGFRNVPVENKVSMVREVFDNVAPKYDLMNDLMSLGIHRLWKGAMVDWLRPRSGMRLADVGGGTGDIAFKFLARGGMHVRVIDINREMLSYGRDRAINRGILDGIEWTHGDAENLPLDDMSVDAYTTAFCIRNVTHIGKALGEAKRVLKPGGRFLCLEFSEVTAPALRQLYNTYSFRVLPALGERITRDRDAYQYLVESIRKFPNQTHFAKMISETGLAQVDFRNLTGGIAAIHSAWRI